jgi:hypothetical protein
VATRGKKYLLASSLVLMRDMKDQAAGLDAVVESCACAVTSLTLAADGQNEKASSNRKKNVSCGNPWLAR